MADVTLKRLIAHLNHHVGGQVFFANITFLAVIRDLWAASCMPFLVRVALGFLSKALWADLADD